MNDMHPSEAAERIDRPHINMPRINMPRINMPRINMMVAAVVALLIAVIVLAIIVAHRFVEDERARGTQAWQTRLGIVADSRTAAANAWFDQNFATLRELAENASLQLYLTELLQGDGERTAVTDEPAQSSYLRNLLVATADRSGFVPPPSSGEVAANVEKVGVAGLGLVDAAARPIIATPGMPPMNDRIRRAVARSLDGNPAIIDMHMGASGLPTIGFVLPVFAVQGDRAQGIGAVVGLRVVDRSFFDLLVQPGETTETSETYLVRKNDITVEYLSILADGTPPLRRALAVDTPDLAAVFAMDKPGGFAIKRNYAGEHVLVTSRPIAAAPWVLVRTISRDEALAAADTRLRNLFVVFVLIIAATSCALFAVWRHGSSLRVAEAVDKYRVTSERFENITKFMRVVTNGQPTQIVAIDGDGRYTFANDRAAEIAGIAAEDMIGKTMAGVIGPTTANIYTAINEAVLKRFEETDDADACRETHIHSFPADPAKGSAEACRPQVIKSEHIPLRGDRDYPPAVLMVLDDITELASERQKSESMLNKLIDTLVSVVDRRDPYAAHHSLRVAEVSRSVAADMGAPKTDVSTVDISGRLMNLGKVYIPADVLTRNADLTDDERAQISAIHDVSADLLRDVPFDLPVVDTIRHLPEWWDGSGPLGLRGEQIMRTARVLAVTNAFVAMISGRAYRKAMTFEQAADILLEQAGSKFDRRVVVALINYVENRGGGSKWSDFVKTRDDVLDPEQTGPLHAPEDGSRPQSNPIT